MEEGGNGRFTASTRDEMDELILRMQQERGVPMAGGHGEHRRTVVDVGGAPYQRVHVALQHVLPLDR